MRDIIKEHTSIKVEDIRNFKSISNSKVHIKHKPLFKNLRKKLSITIEDLKVNKCNNVMRIVMVVIVNTIVVVS